MRLKRLVIKDLPGIESPGFSITTFQEGVNLVTGSNGVGKSSLIRALRYLITEPNRKKDPYLYLEATFEEKGREIEVLRNGSTVVWKRSGTPLKNRPDLQSSEHLEYYWMTIESLITLNRHQNKKVSTQNEQILTQVVKALTGGYDLSGLEKGLEKSKAEKERRELKGAFNTLKRVEKEHEDLFEKGERLTELKGKIHKAKQAERALVHLNLAIELSAHLETVRELENEKKRFSPHIAHLKGDELERLNRLEGQKDRLEKNLKGAKESLSSTKKQLGLIPFKPSLKEQDSMRKGREQVEIYEKRLNRALGEQKESEREQRELEGKRRDQEGILRNLSGSFSEKTEKKRGCLGAIEVQRAEKFSRRWAHVELEISKLETRVESADDSFESVKDPQAKIRSHRRAISCLNRWVALDQIEGESRKNWLLITLFAAALLSLIFSLLRKESVLILSSGVTLLLGSVALLFHKSRRLKRKVARELEQAGFEQNSSEWTREAQDLLEEVQEEYDRVRTLCQKSEERVLFERELKSLREERKKLEKEREAFAEQYGFDPCITTPSAFDLLVKTLAEHQKISSEINHLEASIKMREEQVKSSQREAFAFLKHWEVEIDQKIDQESLEGALVELKRGLEKGEKSKRDIDLLEKDVKRQEEELDSKGKEIEAFYQEIRLEIGDKKGLEESFPLLEKWKRVEKRLEEERTLSRELKRKLKKEPDLIEKAEERSDQLEEMRSQYTEKINLKEGYIQELSRVEGHIKKVKEEHRLEEANRQRYEKQSSLSKKFKERVLGEAAQFLIEDIREKLKSQTDLLEDVKERFARFTSHKLRVEELKIEELGVPVMQISEVGKGKRVRVEELSSAALAQLFLAIRLAWIKHLEEKKEYPPLPIFLDEVLLTSDQERFRAIGKSLISLARDEGRQIIYLAARSNEAIHWKEIVQDRPHLIELDEIRALPNRADWDYTLRLSPNPT